MSNIKIGIRYVVLTGISVVLIAGFLVLMGIVSPPWKLAAASLAQDKEPAGAHGVELVTGQPHTLKIPEEVRKSLGILRKDRSEMIAVAQPPKQFKTMVLPGSTALDPTRLWRIRARFAPARVVEIAQVRDEAASLTAGRTVFRELRSGNRVQKGELLGVFYSADVGNKKNDLIDALVQLKLDQDILDRAEKARAAIPEVFVLNYRRNVNGDRNAIERAVSNLRTWDIPEADIQAIYQEAEEISKRKGERDHAKDKLWPRVELRAPEDGTIVERNVAQSEMVVDNTVNLFQIAQVDRLLVVANVPEDDLPILRDLPSELKNWTVQTVGVNAVKGLHGPIEEIGWLIDPNQHTAIIKGYINNPEQRIRAGQFVAATVRLPPPPDVVEVPIDAVVDDGQQCVVFVQTDKDQHHYTMRRVELTHRFDKTAFIRSRPFTEQEQQRTAHEEELGLLTKEAIRPGERILQTAVGELKAALIDKESRPAKDAKQGKD